MMKSENDLPTLQEAFLGENKRIQAMIKDQNCVIAFILGCLLVGGIVLLCVCIL
jgi:CHASE3 domain sensor protein